MSPPNILEQLRFFDFGALQLLVRAAPDPVIARLINMADHRVRTNLFGAIDHPRMDSIRTLMERENSADPEKDRIVCEALAANLQQLMQTKSIRKDDIYYCA